MEPAAAVTLPSTEQAPGVARRFVRDAGGDWPERVLEAALLVVSEAVTNAVRHGSGRIQLCVAADDRLVRIEVTDEGLQRIAIGAAQLPPAGPEALARWPYAMADRECDGFAGAEGTGTSPIDRRRRSRRTGSASRPTSACRSPRRERSRASCRHRRPGR